MLPTRDDLVRVKQLIDRIEGLPAWASLSAEAKQAVLNYLVRVAFESTTSDSGGGGI